MKAFGNCSGREGKGKLWVGRKPAEQKMVICVFQFPVKPAMEGN